MTFLEQKIRDAHTAGRTALIPFVTAGFPALDTFWGIIEELDANGADVIEIGVPFSDPVADGPVVEDASRRALAAIESRNLLTDDELRGARSVLRAAAMTYVAALLVSFAQLLRLIILYGNRRRD